MSLTPEVLREQGGADRPTSAAAKADDDGGANLDGCHTSVSLGLFAEK